MLKHCQWLTSTVVCVLVTGYPTALGNSQFRTFASCGDRVTKSRYST